MTEKIHHFSVGNSSTGPIGFCADVRATSPDEATERLREALQHVLEVHLRSIADFPDHVEYLNVYINPDAVTASNIDEVKDE